MVTGRPITLLTWEDQFHLSVISHNFLQFLQSKFNIISKLDMYGVALSQNIQYVCLLSFRVSRNR